MDLNLWKQRKKELKFTLLDISQRANIPKRTVDDIFAGVTKNPRTDTVQAIEQALGLNTKIETKTDFLTKDLLAWFNKLSTFQKKYIIETTKFLCLQNKE